MRSEWTIRRVTVFHDSEKSLGMVIDFRGIRAMDRP